MHSKLDETRTSNLSSMPSTISRESSGKSKKEKTIFLETNSFSSIGRRNHVHIPRYSSNIINNDKCDAYSYGLYLNWITSRFNSLPDDRTKLTLLNSIFHLYFFLVFFSLPFFVTDIDTIDYRIIQQRKSHMQIWIKSIGGLSLA